MIEQAYWIFVEGKLPCSSITCPRPEDVPDGTYLYKHGEGWSISVKNSRRTGWDSIQDQRFVPAEVRAHALICATP